MFVGVGSAGKGANLESKTGEATNLLKGAGRSRALIDELPKAISNSADDLTENITKSEKIIHESDNLTKPIITQNSSARWKELDLSYNSDIDKVLKRAIHNYDRILQQTDDIDQIYKKYNIANRSDLDRVKKHVFYDMSLTPNTFPDKEIVAAWDRLSQGTANRADIVFLQHELMESELVAKGMGVDEAHKITEESHNWGIAMIDEGIQKRIEK